MDIFMGIDGSGPGDNTEYTREFTNSFVKRFHNSGVFHKAGYLRGPGMMGTETPGLAASGLRWVREQVQQATRANLPYRIFLSGYSRGGAAVCEIAYQLKQDNITVHAMLLFDAVDRSDLTNSHVDTVSSNVTRCYHAMRDPNAGSREMFGNCATRAAVSGVLTRRHFYGTHGAMGGTPWTTAGANGRVEELSGTERHGASAGASVLLGPIGGAIVRSQADQNTFTNVTLDQERAAVTAVWTWMSGNMATARNTAAS
jgi:hypothetical protein